MSEVRPEAPGFPSRRLALSTAAFSAATGLSRVLGLVREIVVRGFFGVEGAGINAFTVAFQVPNLVRALVADAALTGAFVPVFTELLEKGERARAWRVASSLIWLLLLGLTAITALFMLAAPWIMAAFGYGDDELAVTLARILFPIVILLGISGVIVGILNSYEHFSIPALTPVAWNLVIIAGLVIGVPQATSENAELYVYAGSIVLGTVVQLLLPLPWLAGLDGRLRVAIDWRDPAVKRIFVLMLPVTLGLGLINFAAVIGTFFAARFIDPDLSPSAIDAAFRIYMLPQGMFSVAVATVLFPALARLAARDDLDSFRSMVGTGLRQIAFLLIPASVISVVLAEPIVRLLYERGQFEPEPDPGRRRGARRLLARPHLQRRDADAEPGLFRAPVSLDADRRRTRHAGREHGALRRLLPARHLGDPTRDLGREHPRDCCACHPSAAPARSAWSSAGQSILRCASPPLPPCSARWPSASGGRSTRCSAGPSSHSSSRCSERSQRGAPPTCFRPVCWEFAS